MKDIADNGKQLNTCGRRKRPICTTIIVVSDKHVNIRSGDLSDFSIGRF